MNHNLDAIESIMWRVGAVPALRMTVGNLMLLDRSPSRAALIARVSRAAEQAPRLRWHPEDPTGSRVRQVWVDDGANFDAEQHVRTLATGQPGDQRQLLDLVALLESTPFAPHRPPWDITLIEGLEGGRAALYLRAHHVVTDGRGGVSLTGLLLDQNEAPRSVRPQPAAPEPGLLDPPTAGRRRGTVTVTLDVRNVVRPLAAGVSAALSGGPVEATMRRLQYGVDLVHSVSRQIVLGVPVWPLAPSGSALNRYEVLSVPGARSTALGLGGSRNDLLVAAAAGALGLYYERLGIPCPQLRLAAPASRQRMAGSGWNSFAALRIEIPTASAHPGPHFGVVASRLAEARSEPAIGLTAPLASALSRLPNRLLLPVVDSQVSSIDFIASALPGHRRTGSVAGAAIEASYPFGPRLGCPVNLTAFGHEDRLDVGIAIDPDAITEPEVLLECLQRVLDGFVGASARTS